MFKNYANLAKVSLKVTQNTDFCAYVPKNIYFWTMNSIKNIIIVMSVVALALGWEGCESRQHGMPVHVERLDLELRKGGMPVNEDMRAAAVSLFAISGYGALTDSSLAVYNSAPSLIYHREAVDSVFADMKDVEACMGEAFGIMSHRYPDIHIPKLYAVISPFNQSVITVDSVMFVGLNHYLGVEYRAYEYFPDYIRLNKRRERLVPDVVETLVRQYYPYKPMSDYPTALSRLLYEGAVVEVVMAVAGISEEEALGICHDSYMWLVSNEKQIWNALVGRKLIYSTDESVGESLVRPSSVTSLLHPDAPGRAGRFIGHRIVEEYLKHNDVSPDCKILQPDFYEGEQTLSLSGYH